MCKRTNAVLVIPALDPGEDFISLAEELSNYFDDMIIVNDGSESDAVFLAIKEGLGERCHLLTHEKNKGKGRALKTAFKYFQDNLSSDYLGVITADSDGQHGTEDILMMDAELGKNHTRALHIGNRDLNSKIMPLRSKFGNKINAFLFRYLYGVKLKDTQSGLRAFSSDLMDWLLKLKGERFEYEMYMLIKSKAAGLNLYEHPITTKYFQNHKSHFKTFSDSWRVTSVLFAGIFKFILAALCAGIVDIGLFYLIDYIIIGNSLSLSLALLISTVISRAASSVVNFLFNRFVTFGAQRASGKSVLKYYALWLLQMGASYGLVLAFTSLFGGGEIFVKLVVDFILSLLSYKIQQVWVFKKKDEKA